MFGYISVNRDALSPEMEQRFRAYYCGLCRAIRKGHSLTGAMTLSNDMTFLSIVLSSLYEPDEVTGVERCPVRPFKKKSWVTSSASEYAADMNIMLAYHLCMDDWHDDKNLIALTEAGLIRRAYGKVKEKYPQKCEFVSQIISDLSLIESKPPNGDIDTAANLVGALLGEIFAPYDDIWRAPLTRMGAALGRFIYVMDAYDDLPGDIRKHRFNPLIPISRDADYEQKCLDALTMHIAECTAEFEDMPMLRDADLIRNILYSGVWNKYSFIRSKKEKDNKK